jgi:lysyl-tRNA synthetase, class II
MTDYPYRFERTAVAAVLHERYETLEPGTETSDEARVAGRVKTVRTHGKVGFADVEDSSGRIQLFARHEVLGDEGMESFGSLNSGDIVGARGKVTRTRRGELSVLVDEVTMLAKCTRPVPEKWRGLTDVEARYRQRYLDLMVNPEARRFVAARATANATMRSFLEERGFMEVETPLLQPVASGAVARPFVTHHNALDIDLYLRVAPELYLKRLLIGGLERVYELNRSFRNEGVSTRYNPEFTMLEAYEAYADYEDTMELVEDLVRAVAQDVLGTLRINVCGREVDLGTQLKRVTMFEAIAHATGHDLAGTWSSRDYDSIAAIAQDLGVRVHPAWQPGKVVAEIFEATAEKTLIEPTFVVGFPKEVSPLAKAHRSIAGFTEHADLVVAGIEVAPIYSELNDPVEQGRRFEQQAASRAAGEEEVAVADLDFLEALEYGMPPAGGFGVGVDRLLMVLLGVPSIREVILFPTLRPDA